MSSNTKRLAMDKLKAMLIIGSVRSGGTMPRLGDRVAKYITSKISDKFDIDTVDLIEHKQYAIVEYPHYWRKPQEQDPVHITMSQRIAAADVYILVFPEYNHSLPPALTGFMDHFNKWGFKPCALASYSGGPFGGVRAAVQARAFTSEIGTISVGPTFAAPSAGSSLSPDGKPTSPELEKLYQLQIDKVFGQLDWLGRAMKHQRDTVGVPQ
jgi:NAD(P)H-dependent FMN reductase